MIVDLRDGSRTVAGTRNGNPWAGWGGRFLFRESHEGGPMRVVAARVDGTDPRPFLTVSGPYAVSRCLLPGR